MSPAQSDRNLLFGILAVQMDFVGRDALVAAMSAWVLDKGKPLGHVLRRQGALSEEHLALLEALVQAHLQKHGGDPRQSLSALSTANEALPGLRQITVPVVTGAGFGLVSSAPLRPGRYLLRRPQSALPRRCCTP
jgi:hypothetical protein